MQRIGDTDLRKLFALLTSLALALTVATPALAKDPAVGQPGGATGVSDNLPHPLGERQAAEKTTAQEMILTGKATPKGKNKVVNIAPGQYVQLAFEGADQILTLLGEFGNTIHPVTGGTPGPLHNQIPEPDHSVDNMTIWREDFSQTSYDELLYSTSTFPSMANFYLEASSGRYTVDGYVSDWVQVQYNEARYGTNLCGDIVCSTVWDFVNHQADAWWKVLVAQQGSVAAANAFLASFDVWDRYDVDGDGNFDEPDGYVDHFQSVHAGMGEEVGGGAQGEDAIWSHRWYAWYNANGPEGAGPNGLGGARIGASNYWIGDYTVEPENGGVGVFAHEFAHDLGLPDEYDTSGNTGGAENSTGWWTIMSQGSYGTQNGVDIGSAPTHFNAWDKFQLGWLNYAAIGAGTRGTYHLGPAEFNTKKPQAMFIVLPDKVLPLELGAPYEGTSYFYSGSGNNLDSTMKKSVTVPAAAPTLAAKVRYNIETDWDYAYLTVNGTAVHTNLSTNTSPHGQNFGEGITGTSGGNWVDLTADLSAFAGQTVEIGFRYWTDVAAVFPGFQADAITLGGTSIGTAESDEGWTFDGFRITTGSETQSFFNAYVLENRQYIGYDKALQVGPYNFGFLNNPSLQDFVEHFPLQDGLLVSYWDTSFDDNNVGDHPGGGLILPVDSHPQIETWSNGTQMRPRIQSYDATFTKTATDAITLHNNSVATTIASKPAVSVFDDSKSWWTPSHPSDAPGTSRYQAEWNSVNVPNTGTVVRVKSISSTGQMVIDINK